MPASALDLYYEFMQEHEEAILLTLKYDSKKMNDMVAITTAGPMPFNLTNADLLNKVLPVANKEH